jgi:hypothetical protein
MKSHLQQALSIQAGLRSIFPPAGSGRGAEINERLEFLRRLFDAKIVHEQERSFEDPLIVVVAGGTNVGKSEVFNTLCGERVSMADPRAGRTRRPAVFATTARLESIRRPGFLKGYQRSVLSDPADLDRPMPEGPCFHYLLREHLPYPALLFIDSPDIDSNRLENVAVARQLLAASDVIVFVTSPSKYNDEACVSFLYRTLALGKIVYVVFNLVETEKDRVVGDFQTAVLSPKAESKSPDIIIVPRLPGGTDVFTGMSGYTAGLLEKLAGLPHTETKKRQATRALDYVRRDFGAISGLLKKDMERIERLALAVQDELTAVRSDYRNTLTREPFHEIEAVFQEVLDHFRVPIVDDVLKAPSRAVRWVVRKIQGRDSERDELDETVRHRKEKDRRRLAEMADALRARTLKLLVTGASDPLLADLLERAETGPLGRPAEAAAEKIWDELEPSFQRWKDDMRQEMIDRIQASPNLKALLKTGKAVLQVGSGLLVSVLIGGLGTSDLVIGPLAAKFMQYVLETFGSTYFTGKRDAYLELHLKRFEAITSRVVLEPLRASFPARPELAELEALERALNELEIDS